MPDVHKTLGRDHQVMLDEGLDEVTSGEQLRTCCSDPPREFALAATMRAAADEDADLFEHLADAGDRVCGVTASVRGVEGATRKDESSGGETAPTRTAEHADLDAAIDVAEQRNRARRDRDGYARVSHSRMVWVPGPSTTPARIATLCPPMPSHLEVALELAGIADAITLARFRAPDLRVDTKADQTPVTDADRTTEQALREALQRLRPGQEIVGEEFGGDGEAEWRWLLDPIDGTVNYANGVPVWASLIALMRGDRAVCGVVSAPALGRRWWAATGQGAFTGSGQRMHVSRTPVLEDAYVSCTDIRDFATRRGERGFRSVLERARVVRAFGDFWSHMLVAEGVIDVAVEAWVNPWDVAAAQVILIEAGGRFSDFDGAVRIDSGNVITTNGLLHDELVTLMGDRSE
jgi:histidinol-phosphatase